MVQVMNDMMIMMLIMIIRRRKDENTLINRIDLIPSDHATYTTAYHMTSCYKANSEEGSCVTKPPSMGVHRTTQSFV